MAVQFDTSRFPVVKMTFSGDVSESDITQAGMQLLGVLQRKVPFVLISDMTDGAPSVHQGRTLTALMNQKRDDFRRYMRANLIVISSPLVRTALRAALLASSPPFQVHVETTLAPAEALADRIMLRSSAGVIASSSAGAR